MSIVPSPLSDSCSCVEQDLGDPRDDPYYEPNCECRMYDDPKHPEPPRKLTVKARVSGDGLIISWLPPLSGPVAGYEVCNHDIRLRSHPN